MTPEQNAKLHEALTGQAVSLEPYFGIYGGRILYGEPVDPQGEAEYCWAVEAGNLCWAAGGKPIPIYSTDPVAFKDVLRPAMREQGWRYGLRENLLVGIVKVAWVGHEKGCGAEAPFADEQATAARLAFETLGLERE